MKVTFFLFDSVGSFQFLLQWSHKYLFSIKRNTENDIWHCMQTCIYLSLPREIQQFLYD